MLEAEERLLSRFYQEFWTFLILGIIGCIVTILLLIYYIVKFKKIDINIRKALPIAIIVMCILSGIMVSYFLEYCLDLQYANNREFIHIKGEVIGFAGASADDLTVTKHTPIFLVDETGEEISLNIQYSWNKVSLNQSYEVLYLPNTKIAEVIENNQ